MSFSENAEKSRKNGLWTAAEDSNFVFMKKKYTTDIRIFFSTKW
jgi:hypothetical protein